MKINFYADVCPGGKPENVHMAQYPGHKGFFTKRFKVVVDIPDEAIYGKIDETLPVNETIEVEKGE